MPHPHAARLRHARHLVGTAAFIAVGQAAAGAPVDSVWPVAGPDDTAAVAAAAYSGWYAAADTFEDSIEIRDVRKNLVRTITRIELQNLLPWMTLDGGADGPGALAWTATGRVLYILVHDDTTPGDGLGSDAVLKFDVPSGSLATFARLEAYQRGDLASRLAMVHHKGRLFVGTATGSPIVRVYNALANSAVGTLTTSFTLPSGLDVRGLTIDRDLNTLFMASDSGIWRASLASFPTISPTQIATGLDLRALAWADHFGGPSSRGLYILTGHNRDLNRIDFMTFAQAYSSIIGTPSTYRYLPQSNDLCATADGKLLVGADEDATLVRDDADTRLSFDAWMADEFQQNVSFARGLISPDGEPAGWVIDGDVIPANSRFHPATPDGAGWVLCSLVMNHQLTGDPTAAASIRSVLTRYAGLAPDNIRPLRSADGIYKHWIDPLTGNTEGTWPDEYATLSTMKIVMGAARAMQHFPDDPVIVRAASRIIFRTKNWDAYFQTSTDALAFKGAAGGGPDPFSFSRPFHEGIIFADQAGTYGGTTAQNEKTRWFNRALWPVGTFLTGRPITTANSNQFDSAFLSLYPALLSAPFRADPNWRTQVQNVRWSNAAWTDDNGPRFYTVFSAGTTRSDWGGYRADSLATHPGDLTTFTSLMALCAFGDTPEAVAAYAAYRKSGRQSFKTGASILYRRSDVDRTYLPDSAGLPDVTLGSLGLAELLQPGSIDAALAKPYPTIEMCPVDVNGDGLFDLEDAYRTAAAPTDVNGDGSANISDVRCMVQWDRRNEASATTVRP